LQYTGFEDFKVGYNAHVLLYISNLSVQYMATHISFICSQELSADLCSSCTSEIASIIFIFLSFDHKSNPPISAAAVPAKSLP